MRIDYKAIFGDVKTIAIAGLSPDPSKPSHYVSEYLQKRGYKIAPIYPKGETILGERVYGSLTQIPDCVDMVVMFRKASYANGLIDEAIARGDVKVFWLQEGIINDEACEKAARRGIVAVQDRCAMKIHRETCK
ncbi:MAG: CoA-binding protein [Helicobacteraceae bacterium]|jgi:predicted CoA-binding protein|nr:CoA-binding protein [Helicobacteraceae bacterium]